MATRPGKRTRAEVWAVDAATEAKRSDYVATEEPLEIRLAVGAVTHKVAVTMRTPGADFELAGGFLFGEGVVESRDQIRSIRYCTEPDVDAEQQYNIVTVELDAGLAPDLRALERHFYTSSACGVCGKASLEALALRGCRVATAGPNIDPEIIYGLPEELRASQGIFETTGGLHAAGLFGSNGEVLCVREDIGRHNAVDKVVGWALLRSAMPLTDRILMVSGRSSFEIMQKALAAGIPFVCAVSAPSSLAVSLAHEFGMTLIGFLREGRFNVYAGRSRIRTRSDGASDGLGDQPPMYDISTLDRPTVAAERSSE